MDTLITEINEKMNDNLEPSDIAIFTQNFTTLISIEQNFINTHNENTGIYGKDKADFIRSKEREYFMKIYIPNTLQTIVNKISTDNLPKLDGDGVGNIEVLPYFLEHILEVTQIENSRPIISAVYDEYAVFNEYEQSRLFTELSTKITQLTNNISNITSKETIYSCDKTVVNSLFNSYDSNFLLTFMFLITIHSVLDGGNEHILCNFVKDFLQFIMNHQIVIDNLTQKNIEKHIEQREEELKENNLKTYKKLTKEARIIQKELLRHKIDKWSDLATKERSKHTLVSDDDAPTKEVLEHKHAMEQSTFQCPGEDDEEELW